MRQSAPNANAKEAAGSAQRAGPNAPSMAHAAAACTNRAWGAHPANECHRGGSISMSCGNREAVLGHGDMLLCRNRGCVPCRAVFKQASDPTCTRRIRHHVTIATIDRQHHHRRRYHYRHNRHQQSPLSSSTPVSSLPSFAWSASQVSSHRRWHVKSRHRRPQPESHPRCCHDHCHHTCLPQHHDHNHKHHTGLLHVVVVNLVTFAPAHPLIHQHRHRHHPFAIIMTLIIEVNAIVENVIAVTIVASSSSSSSSPSLALSIITDRQHQCHRRTCRTCHYAHHRKQ